MRHGLRVPILLAAAATLLVACVVVRQPPATTEARPAAGDPVATSLQQHPRGSDAPAIAYRLVQRGDFEAASSSKLWGNFAHRAEICTSIVQHESLDFRAVMHPECSFWNKAIVPAKKAAAVATALLGSPISFLPSSLPEWYVLQHEQVHFAIMELAARQLSQDAARLAAAVPGDPSAAIARLYRKALARARSLHSRFDRETSGKLDAETLESWVNVLERRLASLCDEASPCPVRNEAE